MRSSPNRLIAVIFGAVYIVVGALGFAVTGGVSFLATQGGMLLGIFMVNPLHNVSSAPHCSLRASRPRVRRRA